MKLKYLRLSMLMFLASGFVSKSQAQLSCQTNGNGAAIYNNATSSYIDPFYSKSFEDCQTTISLSGLLTCATDINVSAP